MKVTYLNPCKDILVFCSHSHEDHFNPAIFTLLAKYPSVTFIFSNEIRKAYKKLQKNTTNQLPPVQFLKSRAITPFTTASGEILQIHTLQSTDCGCAFFIEYNGNSIYHAGDLHWWYWEGEDISWNKKMSADYKKEMEYLIDKNIDLAFVPLDPRQGNDYARGIEFFLNNTDTRHIFPMHFWNDFDIIIRYQQEYSVPVHTTFHTPQQDGQCFEIML